MIEKLLGVFLGIVLILTVVICGYIWFTISPIAFTVIDIQLEIEPVEPYDIAKLESVLERNGTHWLIVVKYIDVDTNTTVYEELSYNLESKTLEDR